MKTALILDVATSGFSPHKDRPLEVCCILVELPSLAVLDADSYLISPEGKDLSKAPPFHATLIQEATEGGFTLAKAEGLIMAKAYHKADFLVNRALKFDLEFLAVHMPDLYKALPYQRIDLKPLAALAELAGVPTYESATPRTYRAGDEAGAALEELEYLFLTLAAGVLPDDNTKETQ